MAKNTGMNAKDEEAGRTAHLSPDQAKAVNKKLADEQKGAAPTKTVGMVKKAREKKKNENPGTLLMHKPV